MKQHLSIFSSPYFIFALVTLLLNDFLLKDVFANEFTGKLSDFAGIFVFSIFWMALFPRKSGHVIWLVSIFFIWWKSPWSQPVIDGWNALPFYTIQRVVDYTDLLALVMVPLAYLYSKQSFSVPRLNPVFPFVISMFAFAATSKGPMTCFYDDVTYSVSADSREQFIEKLKSSELELEFPDYGNDELQNQHCEVLNLNDSISSLVVLIGPYNSSENEVELSLGCWKYNSGEGLENADKKTLKKHRNYVQQSFEDEVLSLLD